MKKIIVIVCIVCITSISATAQINKKHVPQPTDTFHRYKHKHVNLHGDTAHLKMNRKTSKDHHMPMNHKNKNNKLGKPYNNKYSDTNRRAMP